MKTIEESWQEFRASFISPTASHAQIAEMRFAFYAGFTAMLNANLELHAMDWPHTQRIMRGFYDEAQRFARHHN